MKISLLLWLALVRIGWNQMRFEEEEPNGAASIGHLVSVRMLKMERIKFGIGHICAGSLIRDNAVLTAAQCFMNPEGTFLPISNYLVVVGTPNRFEPNPNTMIFLLKYRVIMQDWFDLTSYETDVALLILTSSVPKQHAVVKPIPIADQTFQRTTECQMSGWGRNPSGYRTKKVVSVTVTIIGTRICEMKQITQEFIVRPGMICGKHLNKLKRSYCSGDVGGSLVCQGQLAGIISWGIKCSNPFHPGIYTDVLYYAQWINESLADPTKQDDYFAEIAKPKASAADPGMRPFSRSIRFFVQSINILCRS